MSKGKFIVLDGNDGSGKQTQSELLRDFLSKQNKKGLQLSFPRYEETFFGGMLKELLAGKYGNFVDLDPHLASLPYAVDRWSSKDLIESTLEDGGFVICDRYASANQIHQGGKVENIEERKEFLSWLDRMEYKELKIPKPDIFVYLDVPLEISLGLMNKKNKDTVENNHKYLSNSRESAEWLIKQNPDKWVNIQCVHKGKIRTRKDIHKEIVSKLEERKLL
ncbi:MAG TPA: thymidylate kinase [Candidatus Paceibacterota bacterium]